MQDKQLFLKKIKTYSLVILFFGTILMSILNIPMIAINIVSFFASSALYLTLIFEYKLKYKKYHIPLVLLAILCILFQLLNVIYLNKVLGLLVSTSVYAYYIYYDKLMTGKLNKSLLGFGLLICGTSLLSIFFKNKLITSLFLLIEILIYIKLSNKIFTSLAYKRQKKLDKDGFTEEDAKKIPWIRKFLFGKTGKLDLSIVSMITGKEFPTKK